MKYSHVFSIAFTVESDNDPDHIMPNELWYALERRLADLPFHEIYEAVALEDSEAQCDG
jgi:hypothetical protein